MARPQSIGIRRRLNALLPPEKLERLARESGMLRRRRKLDPVAMLWTLVLGFDAGRTRSLAGLRRVYQRVSGTLLAPSSFHARFSPQLVCFLRRVLDELIERQSAVPSKAAGLLAPFADIALADGSVLKLHRLLAGRYPGTRTNSSPAAAKLHLVMSVMGKGVQRVKLTGERESERRALRVGPWVRDRLLIFDLGYFRYQLFDRIDCNGGYFLSRLSGRANPRIVAVHRRWRGRSVALEGKRLKEIAGQLKREELDVEVEVTFKRRVYKGRRSTARRRFRLVGVRDVERGTYRFYLTNIAPDTLDAHAIAQVYSVRWQVELAFREMKSHYRLDQLPSRKAAAVEALVLTSLITMMVSRELLEAVRRRVGEQARRLREERWAALLSSVAADILDVVLLPARTAGVLARRLEPMLLHEAIDPNARRMSLPERVDQEAMWSR